MVDKYGSLCIKELKTELRLRNAKTSGKKRDLIERLAAYDRNNDFQMTFSFEENATNTSREASRILWPPDNEFSSVQITSTVPSIDIVHINNYFLKTCTSEEGMSMYAAVHRKGFNMMQNKFLLALTEVITKEYYFYRAQVHSEFTRALTYFLKLVLEPDGSIAEASCECIAGKGTHAVCKHVAVVCYALLNLKDKGEILIRSTCTDNKQVWHMPKKKKLEISPKKAQDINYAVTEYNKSKKQMSNLCYDPRLDFHKNLPSFNDNIRNSVITYNSRQIRSLAISDSFPAASIIALSNDHDYLSYPILHQMVYNIIQVSEEDVQNIEKITRGQNKSSTWFRERSVRLTASKVGIIIHMTDRKNVESFINSIIHPQPFKSKAIDWGKANEKNAIKTYERTTTNCVVPCGLFISVEHPYLAATPDGLVRELTVLEVKCPYSIRNSLISADSLPYLEEINGELSLKTNSNYYFQVQVQMYVTGREFCDFFIWTVKDYKCISVVKNNDVINNMILPIAKKFYDKNMVPALTKKYYKL